MGLIIQKESFKSDLFETILTNTTNNTKAHSEEPHTQLPLRTKRKQPSHTPNRINSSTY
jgi:hypothetical protein